MWCYPTTVLVAPALLFLVLATATASVSWEDSSWLAPRCVNMWSEFVPGAPLEGREVFTVPRDLNEKPLGGKGGHDRATHTIDLDLAIEMDTNATWPPGDRGTVAEFYEAVGARKTTLSSFYPSNRFRTMAAKVDYNRRLLYIKNLKAGSSTVDTLIDPIRKSEKQASRKNNQTTIVLRCMEAPSSKECSIPKWIDIDQIPDIMVDSFFTFSFTRDPFTRVVSSHREFGGHDFTEILQGNIAKISQNPHFVSQVFTFTRPTLSGRSLRLDFVGRLEHISEDWARLKPAFDSNACKLSPEERRNLILSRVDTDQDNIVTVSNHRESPKSEFTPFSVESGNPKPFLNYHVILTCRRYIQDLVCFNMKIPRICIQHPELIFDLDPVLKPDSSSKPAEVKTGIQAGHADTIVEDVFTTTKVANAALGAAAAEGADAGKLHRTHKKYAELVPSGNTASHNSNPAKTNPVATPRQQHHTQELVNAHDWFHGTTSSSLNDALLSPPDARKRDSEMRNQKDAGFTVPLENKKALKPVRLMVLREQPPLQQPWTWPRCTNMWGAPQSGNPTPLGREVFTVPRDLDEQLTGGKTSLKYATRQIDPALAALMATNVTWPPADRGIVDDFFRAVGPRRSSLEPYAAQHYDSATAKIDHVKRLIVVKILKSGSSTIDHLFDPEQQYVGSLSRNRLNSTEVMLQCMHAPSSSNRCRAPSWVNVKDIPKEVQEAYLIFAMVRDPFSRVISSHHEFGFGKASFTNIVSGKVAKIGQNVHFIGQFYSISRAIFSGEQLRVDFVGRLESLAADWARLQPAIDETTSNLSPRERLALILPRADSTIAGGGDIPHHRASEEASTDFLPYSVESGHPEHFRILHIILVCRRYIQDLVCFDMPIPKVCIDHAELVLDLDEKR